MLTLSLCTAALVLDSGFRHSLLSPEWKRGAIDVGVGEGVVGSMIV